MIVHVQNTNIADIIGNLGIFDLCAYFPKQFKMAFANISLIYSCWVTNGEPSVDFTLLIQEL